MSHSPALLALVRAAMDALSRRTAAVLLAGWALAGATYSAWRSDFTYDEPFHLRWSERLLESGETERASQERFNSKTPAMLPNVLARKAAQAVGARDPRVLRLAARLPTIAWLALLLAAGYRLARRLAGEQAALVASAGLALDPNLAAHGSLATVDCLYALATLLTLAAALRFARAPGARSGALLGLALGAAFATKFTAVLLVLGLALLPLCAARGAWRAWSARRLLAGLALAGVVTVLCIDLVYLGIGVLRPLREIPLRSATLAPVAAALPELRLPLPEAFLTGLDRTLGSERGWGPVVLLGHAFPDGASYYFLVCWALKTPLLLAGAQLIGLWLWLRDRSLRHDPALRFVALNLALTLAYFSFLFKAQIGYRFVLMCLPLLWILAAAGLARAKGSRVRAAWAGAMALALFENAAYLGNTLSFTNAAVWPKRQAFRLLADSNLDWGQNDDKVGAWMAAAGIPEARLDPVHLLAGPILLSVNAAAGVFDFEQHRFLREHLDPAEQLGHTHLRFDVSNELFDRFMDEQRRLSPEAAAVGWCSDGLEYEKVLPGGQVAFVRDTAPAPGRIWLSCVRTRDGADLGFRVRVGLLRVGRVTPDRSCATELLKEGQVAWRRLTPGTHALCAVEIPNRRAHLPYRVQGAWIVRGHGAEIAVRPQAAGADGAIP